MRDLTWNMKPNRPLARQLAIRDIPSLVFDAVNLEGVPMTLPEVQTILDGITVGGHKISDQNMAINQADAYKTLFKMIDTQTFSFSKSMALALHKIAARDEALAWGEFRTGQVTVNGTDYKPPLAEDLDETWRKIETEVAGTQDIYECAFTGFLRMARAQFFWDVNKRTGRLMMNGMLLDHGFPIINVPAKRQQEFNELMLNFYDSADMEPMNAFLRDCLNPTVIDNFR